ncbi:Uncharacterized protein dnm_055390 [Desulfonema magnum]|uniref:Uncharacterized protein n=1 Tax=Desulfonema magnum TaxID=45655 RepID=A0A975BPY7_9BACT|nr:Uncharacterized protein dnm_055390 [Desulfonema magnum]
MPCQTASLALRMPGCLFPIMFNQPCMLRKTWNEISLLTGYKILNI